MPFEPRPAVVDAAVFDAVVFDAVVLAGGTGRRLGGASKPDVLLAGRRLLDHALAATAGARRVVVVAPEDVAVPDGVLRTLEDPPHGGPVAGIAAGLAALDAARNQEAPEQTKPRRAAPLVLILACDVPHAASAVPRLLSAAVRAGEPDGGGDADGGGGPDGAVLVDADDHPQWLAAVYRSAALRARLRELPPAGASVRALVSGLVLAAVPASGDEAADVDTWDDLTALDSP